MVKHRSLLTKRKLFKEAKIERGVNKKDSTSTEKTTTSKVKIGNTELDFVLLRRQIIDNRNQRFRVEVRKIPKEENPFYSNECEMRWTQQGTHWIATNFNEREAQLVICALAQYYNWHRVVKSITKLGVIKTEEQ